ncbi:hypothetical protein COW46_00820 [Candidatus Gracilibacteria bacterium CG17_big_fil_post_rev_8_21_14_2_50_48_13]|nr:MAG: hypothetical protein COW46_00820 [Candidatus Gracilibacteria bacterium CG17_big_fil_post_rev_8_21_14_2_50_48_13]
MDKKNRGYRKPVPLDIYNYPEFGYHERALWFEIYFQCANTAKRIKVKHGNCWVFVTLECGQMLLNVSEYAALNHFTPYYVKSMVESLSFGYSEMQITRHTCGLIITVLEHEELKKMQITSTITTTSRQHHDDITTTSYSNKSGKSGRSLRSTNQGKNNFSDENSFFPAKHWNTWKDVPDKVIEKFDERYFDLKFWRQDMRNDKDNLRLVAFNYFKKNPHETL